MARRRLRTGLWAVLLAGGCSGQAETPPPQVQAPLPLDERLEPGQVRAGVITKDSELIGGISAKGQAGDFKLYNDRVAVIIGQPGVARGYNPYGGGILDADIIRADGDAGRSAFGEAIVTADLFILNGERVEVVDDGRDGAAARVRVTGKVDDMPLFSALFAALFGTEPYALEWRVDYVLAPNAHHVAIDFELYNPGRETVEIGLPGAGFIFDAADAFVQGYGFSPPRANGAGAYYGAVTEHVSYLYGAPNETLNVVLTQSGIVIAGLGDLLKVRARERRTYRHVLVIGDQDLAKTQAQWRAALGLAVGAAVTGRVVDSAGETVPGARVHVQIPEPVHADRDYVSRAIADEQGRFEVHLEPGDYLLSAVTDGLTRSPAVAITVGRAAVASEDLVTERAGRLAYQIQDDQDRDLPSKLSVRPLVGGLPAIPDRFGERGIYYGLTATEFAHSGQGRIELPPGTYEVFVSRGIEYEIDTQQVEITPGETTSMQAVLTRSVATPGWMTTDTHVHSQLSPDSPDSFEDKVRAMVVENLEVPVSTEHEAIGDFNPAIEALGLGDWMHGIVGSEVTTYVYGHFNAYPLVADPAKPGNGRIDWFGKPPAETFAAIRANPGDPFIQVNHPRAASVGGYFSAMGYDRESGEARRADEFSMDFDGIEVMNGCSGSGVRAEEVQDWFSFLNRGHRIFGVGSTDNHRSESGNMGLPATYVRMPGDDPRAATDDDFRRAFKQGRLVVSCGPFLEVKIGDAEIGDVAPVSGDLVSLEVHVGAPSWMDVDAIEVVVNGEIVKRVPLGAVGDGTVRFDGTVTASVTPGQDGWVVVAVEGDRRHGIWARNRPSFAFTNPIFLDGDADGQWVMR